MGTTTIKKNEREFDLSEAGVFWWCDQNMIWDDDPKPRDCTPESPHPPESGRCCWALVAPELEEK